MTDFVLVIAAAGFLAGAPAAAPPGPAAEALALPASNVALASPAPPKTPLPAAGPARRVFGELGDCERAAATVAASTGKRAFCLPHAAAELAESAY